MSIKTALTDSKALFLYIASAMWTGKMLKNFYRNGIYMYFICNYGQTNIQEVVIK